MKINYYKDIVKKLSIYDHISILKLARELKKEINVSEGKRIAVLGSCSLHYFVMVLKLFLIKYDINADLYEGEYDGINMAILDNNSTLYKFQPEIVIILCNYRDIRDMPLPFSTKADIDTFITDKGQYYKKLWVYLSKLQGCHIFQSNFVTPIERSLGNLEANLYCSERNIYHLINRELINNKLPNVTIVDMEYMASLVGKENWFDYTLFFTSKVDFSLKYVGLVCETYAQQISALQGKIRKCLIVDLDNTIWGGVVADEGPRGIKIDPNDAIGEAYQFFQRYILKLKSRGVLLAVISKNDYQLAKEPFDINENMILKYDDFSSFIANWNSKAINIDIVAKELNISTDSLVFFDDNPAEREIVKMYHPEVLVIDVPENVAEYVLALEKAHPFEWLNLTEEDLNRGCCYKSNKERKQLNSQFEDYQEYLLALRLKGKVDFLKEENTVRFAQLINKSNQFNLRTQRYSEAEILKMLQNERYKLLTVTLEDRFSKFGIISCVILKKIEEKCFIDTWVISCRVIKRDVEYLTFNKILEIAKQWGCKTILGEYIPTKKNILVKDFFPKLGFHIIENESKNGIFYKCNVDRSLIRNIVIEEVE